MKKRPSQNITSAHQCLRQVPAARSISSKDSMSALEVTKKIRSAVGTKIKKKQIRASTHKGPGM